MSLHLGLLTALVVSINVAADAATLTIFMIRTLTRDCHLSKGGKPQDSKREPAGLGICLKRNINLFTFEK